MMFYNVYDVQLTVSELKIMIVRCRLWYFVPRIFMTGCCVNKEFGHLTPVSYTHLDGPPVKPIEPAYVCKCSYVNLVVNQQ